MTLAFDEQGWVEAEPGVYVDEDAAIGRALGMGWSFADADFECAHGRLGSDPTPPCGCWPSKDEILEPAGVEHPTPDLMNILTRKEPLMLTAAPERLALPAPTVVVHVTTNALLAKIADDIDAEVARLLDAKARLLAVVA